MTSVSRPQLRLPSTTDIIVDKIKASEATLFNSATHPEDRVAIISEICGYYDALSSQGFLAHEALSSSFGRMSFLVGSHMTVLGAESVGIIAEIVPFRIEHLCISLGPWDSAKAECQKIMMMNIINQSSVLSNMNAGQFAEAFFNFSFSRDREMRKMSGNILSIFLGAHESEQHVVQSFVECLKKGMMAFHYNNFSETLHWMQVNNKQILKSKHLSSLLNAFSLEDSNALKRVSLNDLAVAAALKAMPKSASRDTVLEVENTFAVKIRKQHVSCDTGTLFVNKAAMIHYLLNSKDPLPELFDTHADITGSDWNAGMAGFTIEGKEDRYKKVLLYLSRNLSLSRSEHSPEYGLTVFSSACFDSVENGYGYLDEAFKTEMLEILVSNCLHSTALALTVCEMADKNGIVFDQEDRYGRRKGYCWDEFSYYNGEFISKLAASRNLMALYGHEAFAQEIDENFDDYSSSERALIVKAAPEWLFGLSKRLNRERLSIGMSL